jgi:transcriptional activator of cad operon
VKLERRLMQLLLCLADHPGQILSVEQLLDRVWTGVVVTQDSVYQAIASLRRILGDDASEPTYITNIPRRGYSLIAPVSPWVDAPGPASVKTAPRRWWIGGTTLAALILNIRNSSASDRTIGARR